MSVFPTPLFALKPDAMARQYVNVSNRLSIAYRGREFEKYVQVPATLFPIMRALGVSRSSEVTLYLDEEGKRMVFGIAIDDAQIIDLWLYTHDRIPPSFLRPR